MTATSSPTLLCSTIGHEEFIRQVADLGIQVDDYLGKMNELLRYSENKKAFQN